MRGFYLYDPVDVDDDFGLIIKTCPDRSIFRLLSGSMLVAGRSDGKSPLHCWVEKVVPNSSKTVMIMMLIFITRSSGRSYVNKLDLHLELPFCPMEIVLKIELIKFSTFVTSVHKQDFI